MILLVSVAKMFLAIALLCCLPSPLLACSTTVGSTPCCSSYTYTNQAGVMTPQLLTATNTYSGCITVDSPGCPWCQTKNCGTAYSVFTETGSYDYCKCDPCTAGCSFATNTCPGATTTTPATYPPGPSPVCYGPTTKGTPACCPSWTYTNKAGVTASYTGCTTVDSANCPWCQTTSCGTTLTYSSANSGNYDYCKCAPCGAGCSFADYVCPTTPVCSRVLTKAQVQQVKTQLAGIIQGLAIPQAIRLAFHSCLGGCNGCMNFNDPDNKGNFVAVFNTLNTFYSSNNLASIMSRADLFALAGIVAVEQGVINNNNVCQSQGYYYTGQPCIVMRTPNIPFSYCRQDCPTSPSTNVLQGFPSGTFNFTQVMSFFSAKFGLSQQQAVALLGAHTVGGAAGVQGSGFSGHWKEGTASNGVSNFILFNNGYFKNLVDQTIFWSHDVNNNSQHLWQFDGFRNGFQNGDRVSFMLDSDVALVLDVNVVNATNGLSSCGFQSGCQSAPATKICLTQCNPSPTAALVNTYATNPVQFMNDFTVAFQIMINNGLTNPQSPG